MLTAADVMTKDVAMIRSSATVKEAVDLMRARDWRALIVDRRHEQDAYGIITESDIVYKVIGIPSIYRGKSYSGIHDKPKELRADFSRIIVAKEGIFPT